MSMFHENRSDNDGKELLGRVINVCVDGLKDGVFVGSFEGR